MTRALLAAACATCLGACAAGPRFARFEPARGPKGVRVEATVTKSSAPRAWTAVTGELLEVRAEGLLVLGTLAQVRQEGKKQVPMQSSDGKTRLVLVAFARIEAARFDGMGKRCDLRDGAPPTDEVRERLRLVSRFPQGLSPELQRRLLEIHGEAEIQRLGP